MNTELSIENKIALFFRNKREENQLTRSQLAKILEVDLSIVTNYELLRNNIQLPVFIKLFDVFMGENITVRGFIRDLSFLNPEDFSKSAVTEPSDCAFVLPLAGLKLEDLKSELDDNLRQEGTSPSNEDRKIAARAAAGYAKSRKKQTPPTNGLGFSVQPNKFLQGSNAVLLVDGKVVGKIENFELTPSPTVSSTPNLDSMDEVDKVLKEAESLSTNNLENKSTEDKIVWDD